MHTVICLINRVIVMKQNKLWLVTYKYYCITTLGDRNMTLRFTMDVSFFFNRQ